LASTTSTCSPCRTRRLWASSSALNNITGRCLGARAHCLQHVGAIDLWQTIVQDQQIGGAVLQMAQGHLAVEGHSHLVTGLAQPIRQALGQRGVVFRDHDAQGWPLSPGGCRGSLVSRRNSVPTTSVISATTIGYQSQ
jgi:hypothetical protein